MFVTVLSTTLAKNLNCFCEISVHKFCYLKWTTKGFGNENKKRAVGNNYTHWQHISRNLQIFNWSKLTFRKIQMVCMHTGTAEDYFQHPLDIKLSFLLEPLNSRQWLISIFYFQSKNNSRVHFYTNRQD